MENKQHTQVPNGMGKDNLNPKDQFIYAVIKSFQNGKTGECFPSLQKIAERGGTSIPTVRECLKKLVDAGYITIKRDGRKNVYTFSEYKKFEPVSLEFLENKNISFGAKAYVLAAQQYMFKDIEGLGKLSLPNTKLASLINSNETNIRRYNTELESKHYLQVVKNKARDIQTGLKTETRIFELNELGQAIIWTLANHEDRISQNTEDIDLLKDHIKTQDKLIRSLIEKLNEKSDTPIEYNF